MERNMYCQDIFLFARAFEKEKEEGEGEGEASTEVNEGDREEAPNSYLYG